MGMNFMANITRSVLLLILAGTLQAAPISFLQVLPASQTVNVGQTFEVSVFIYDVVDLAAWQFDFGFDPAILAATAINYDLFLGPDQEVLTPTIDNAFGSVTSIGAYLLAGPGATGFGQLVSLQFTALAPGQSSVSPFNLILLDSTFGDIPFGDLGQPATVTVVNDSNGVPEPATLWLTGTLAALIAVRARRISRS